MTFALVIDTGSSKIPKMASVYYLYNILKKKGGMKLIFLHGDKYQTFLHVDLTNLVHIARYDKIYPKSQVIIISQEISEG